MAEAVARARAEVVDDLDDPRLDDYRDLPAAARRRAGTFVVESRLVVRELIAGRRFGVRSVLCTEAARASLGDVLADVPVVLVTSDELIRRVVGFQFHGGCLAAAARGTPPSLDALLERRPRRLVVLERVSNPDNVGGVFRNARAFGADAVVVGPHCTDPLSRKAIRAAMGASLVVPWGEAGDWPSALATLHDAGLVRIALTPRPDACDVAALGGAQPVPSRFALLVGAEGPGLGPEALAAADLHVRIAMAPGVDSLNVATATGIALHRLAG